MSIKALDADTRSLDQLYEAAQKESGPLIVSSGGDGMPSRQFRTATVAETNAVDL